MLSLDLMNEKNKPKVNVAIPEICAVVKRVRLAYGDSQEQFARRVMLSSMTISRFELGKAVPSDPDTLHRLYTVAAAHGLKAEARLLLEAKRDRLPSERFAQFARLTIPFHSLEEWRLMCAARIAARYFSDEAVAIQKAAPRAMEMVDAILRDDTSKGIVDYDLWEERLTELAEQRALERIQQARKKK